MSNSSGKQDPDLSIGPSGSTDRYFFCTAGGEEKVKMIAFPMEYFRVGDIQGTESGEALCEISEMLEPEREM